MSPGLRQVALTCVSLGVIGLIGVTTAGPPRRAVGSPASTVAAGPPPSVTPATLPFVEGGHGSATPRSLTVRIHPEGAQADLTVIDATGSTHGTGEFTGRLSGEVRLRVAAPGYRPESHVIPAGQTGIYEVLLDPTDQLVDRRMAIATGPAPKQVAFTPDGSELWVTLLAGSGLEVYDPDHGRLLAEIDLPEAGSVEAIFDAKGETAWVSQMETARVYEIDVESRRIRRTLPTGGSWTKGMVLSPDESRLWASNWVSDDVSEFDLTTGDLLRKLPTVTTPRGLATDASGSQLYVAGYESGEIEVIDLDTGEGRVIHRTGGAMRHLVRDPATGRIYASDMATDTVYAVDPATDRVKELTSTDRLPNTVDVSAGGGLLAVSNRGRNNPEGYHLPGPEWGSVLLVDTATGELLDALVAGNQPTGLDLSADGRRLAYSDFLDDRVTVLAVPSLSELRAGEGGRTVTYRDELQK